MSERTEIIYDDESEQAVLGAMMENAEAIPIVMRILDTPYVFYNKAHQIIYSAIAKVYEENKTGDVMLVAKEIKRGNHANRIGGLFYLSDLLDRVVDTENAEYYAELVKENYMRRQLIRIGGTFKSMAHNMETCVVDLIDKATGMITDLTVKPAQSTWIPDTIHGAVHVIVQSEDAEEDVESIETGFYDLDENHTINDRGTMTTITADSGGGKTTLLRNIMLHRFGQGFKTLMFPTEETQQRMAIMHAYPISARNRVALPIFVNVVGHSI